jgi:diguanylate cyclase (GGDEF)-like protein
MTAMAEDALRGEQRREPTLAERLEIITRIARRLFRVPIVTLSLVQGGRLRLTSCQGVPVNAVGTETPLDAATLASAGPWVLHDARADPRFAKHSWVAGKPFLRSYAGTVIMNLDGSRAGVLGLADREQGTLGEGDLMLLRDVARLAETELAMVMMTKSRELTGEQGERPTRRTAEVTGAQASDRHAILELLDREFHRARREREYVSIILARIDPFEGQDAANGVADAVVTEVAQRLGTVVRRSDPVTRSGANDFFVFLSRCDVENAFRLAERMRHQVRRLPVATARADLNVSLTLGVAAVDPDTDWTPDRLIQSAEEALAAAIAEGGDRVMSRKM